MSLELLKTPGTIVDKFVNEIKLEPNEKQLSNLFKSQGPIKSIILSYDFFLDNRWPRIAKLPIYLDTQQRQYAVHTRYARPELKVGTTTRDDPNAFKDVGETYRIISYGVWITEQLINGTWTTLDKSGEVQIGIFPLMLGGKYCWTFGKSAEELLKVGISDVDPLGYFIIKGRERQIQCQEKLTFDRVIVANFFKTSQGPRKLAAQVSVNTLTGTRKFEVRNIYENKGNFSSEIGLSFSGKDVYGRMINIYRAYRILTPDLNKSLTSRQIADQFEASLQKFLHKPSRWLSTRSTTLIITRTIFTESKISDVEYIQSLMLTPGKKKKEIHEERKKYIRSTYATTEQIFEWMYTEFMPNIDEQYPNLPLATRRQMKLNYIFEATAKYIEVSNKVIPPDDRDAWPNKGVWSPGFLMDQLVSIERYNTIKGLPTRRNKISPARWWSEVTKSVNDHILDVFSSDNWGASYTKTKKQGVIVDRATQDRTIALLYSDMTNIKPPLNKRSSHAPVTTRMIQATQVRFIDVVYTPEDDQVGLKKALAKMAVMSIEQLEAPLYEQILVEFKELEQNVAPGEQKITQSSQALKQTQAEQKITQPQQPIHIALNGKRLPGQYSSINAIRSKFIEIYRQRKWNCMRPEEITYSYRAGTNIFNIYCSAGRILCPLAVVQNGQRTEIIDWADPNMLLDPHILISQSDLDLREAKKQYEECTKRLEEAKASDVDTKTWSEMLSRAETMYLGLTHIDIDPTVILGIGSNLNPIINYEPVPRGVFNTKIGTHALGCSPVVNHSYEPTVKVLMYPDRPYFETQTSTEIGLNIYPNGCMALAAIKMDDANQEDGIELNRQSVKNGLFKYLVYNNIKVDISTGDSLRPPDRTNPAHSKLGISGLIEIGETVKPEDIVANVYHDYGIGGSQPNPVRVGPYKNGKVVDILKRSDKQYIIKIAEERIYGDADKLAARYAQKGLATVVKDPEDLPKFLIDGEWVVPDLLINPLGLIGRNTPGWLIEGLSSMAGILSGQRYNASSFKSFDRQKTEEYIASCGYDPNMSYVAINPYTNEPYESKITLVPIYYQALPHHILDKYQIRAVGRRKPLTGQPVGHRDTHGAQAQRFGEQEVLATTSHGMASVLVERISASSDAISLPVCQTCGNVSRVVYGEHQIQVDCRICPRDKMNIGRIKIPRVAETFRQINAGFGIEIRYTGLEPVGKK